MNPELREVRPPGSGYRGTFLRGLCVVHTLPSCLILDLFLDLQRDPDGTAMTSGGHCKTRLSPSLRWLDARCAGSCSLSVRGWSQRAARLPFMRPEYDAT